jgi:hypothetical protein
MLTTAGPAFSTSSVKSGNMTTGAAGAAIDGCAVAVIAEPNTKASASRACRDRGRSRVMKLIL